MRMVHMPFGESITDFQVHRTSPVSWLCNCYGPRRCPPILVQHATVPHHPSSGSHPRRPPRLTFQWQQCRLHWQCNAPLPPSMSTPPYVQHNSRRFFHTIFHHIYGQLILHVYNKCMHHNSTAQCVQTPSITTMDFELGWKAGIGDSDRSQIYEQMSTVWVNNISRSRERCLEQLKYDRLRYSINFVAYSRVFLPKYSYWIKIILKSLGDANHYL